VVDPSAPVSRLPLRAAIEEARRFVMARHTNVLLEKIEAHFKAFREGLEGIRGRVDSTFDQTGKNFEALGRVEDRMTNIEGRVKNIETTTESIEMEVKEIRKDVGELKSDMKDVKNRLVAVEAK
jgi:septation ring formation regulator EzrA